MLRFGAAAARRIAAAPAARRLSGAADGHDGGHGDYLLMKRVTFVVMPVIGATFVWAMNDHYQHHHDHHDSPAYPYLRVRAKPYPWKWGDCNLFDSECKKKAKEAAKK